MADNGKPLNSFEPLNEPQNGLKENGQYLISEIEYAKDYPNSFLDIIYPDENREAVRPTLFYFHGGGFFAGSKNMGDPLAANEATALIDDLCAAGYNIVNVDYALVPDEHFPVPLIQANQAFSYIMKHSEVYHLNMDQVILMGSSAGAIMSCQMGTVITTPEYAELLGISPALAPEQVCAIVADDAPLDYESFTLACKFLVGNYVKGSIFLNKDELNCYDCIPHMTSDYPPSIMGSARALFSKYGEKIPLQNVMLASSVLCVASYLLIGLTKAPSAGLIGCMLCGFSVGIFWPGTFSLSAARLRNGGTLMFALLALAGDLGCGAGPTIAGKASALFGNNLHSGILCGIVFPCIMLCCVFLMNKSNKKGEVKNEN